METENLSNLSDLSIGDIFEEDGKEALRNLTEQVEAIARDIVDTEAMIKGERSRLKVEEDRINTLKEKLAEILIAGGQGKGMRLPCGLNPIPDNKVMVKRIKDVPVDCLYQWLEENGLDDIIKKQVHPATLNATAGEWEEQGGSLPLDILERSETLSVKFLGKTDYLNSKDSKVS